MPTDKLIIKAKAVVSNQHVYHNFMPNKFTGCCNIHNLTRNVLWGSFKLSNPTSTDTNDIYQLVHLKFLQISDKTTSSPPGSLTGLYSKALLQIRSMSFRKSLAVGYWCMSILDRTVERSMGCLITAL